MAQDIYFRKYPAANALVWEKMNARLTNGPVAMSAGALIIDICLYDWTIVTTRYASLLLLKQMSAMKSTLRATAFSPPMEHVQE